MIHDYILLLSRRFLKYSFYQNNFIFNFLISYLCRLITIMTLTFFDTFGIRHRLVQFFKIMSKRENVTISRYSFDGAPQYTRRVSVPNTLLYKNIMHDNILYWTFVKKFSSGRYKWAGRRAGCYWLLFRLIWSLLSLAWKDGSGWTDLGRYPSRSWHRDTPEWRNRFEWITRCDQFVIPTVPWRVQRNRKERNGRLTWLRQSADGVGILA